jgi:2-polyprenyl-3-methyl-5-hydroxy-6-metoxy-1,4-benzoquinol methylase
MLGSRADRRVRDRFQRLVMQRTPAYGTILDFGAGTGIDAKQYAARGFKVLVHEPLEANLTYLREYCRDEIVRGEVTVSDTAHASAVDTIAANFAVLNLIGDHTPLFAKFRALLVPGGSVVLNLLNPFFLGDVRYRWWRKNLHALFSSGGYAVEGGFGPIYRFTPSAVRRAARPNLDPVACLPGRAQVATSRYIFMLFRKT